MKSKPCEMSLIGGGVSAEEMNKILGARCVCSSTLTLSASYGVLGDDVCQCSFGPENHKANAKIAGIEIPY